MYVWNSNTSVNLEMRVVKNTTSIKSSILIKFRLALLSPDSTLTYLISAHYICIRVLHITCHLRRGVMFTECSAKE